MTKDELYSIRNLNSVMRALEQRRAMLLSTAEDLVPIVDGMPRVREPTKSKVAELATKILTVDEALDTAREQIVRAKISLTKKILADVSDSALQKFAILRYVKCLSYKDTAHFMRYTLRHVYRLQDRLLKNYVT